MQNVLIAGGSGFIGKRLTTLLQKHGYTCAWLSRGSATPENVQAFHWNPAKGQIDLDAISWAHHIIILSGAGIAEKRWTEARKKYIISSRVDGIQLIKQSSDQQENQVRSIICASAVGFYGSRGDAVLTEDSTAGEGFLSSSTQAWEAASHSLQKEGRPLAILRIGLVLGREAGLLMEMDNTLRFGIRPILGNGKQVYPWIHVDDASGIFLHALQEKLSGSFNAVAPAPVTQNALLKGMVKARGTLAIPAPAPAFVLRIMLGEMANAVLASQNVSAEKTQKNGYEFQFSNLSAALKNLYGK